MWVVVLGLQKLGALRNSPSLKLHWLRQYMGAILILYSFAGCLTQNEDYKGEFWFVKYMMTIIDRRKWDNSLLSNVSLLNNFQPKLSNITIHGFTLHIPLSFKYWIEYVSCSLPIESKRKRGFRNLYLFVQAVRNALQVLCRVLPPISK